MTAEAKKLILLVEDNEKIMEGNVKKFIREGYDVACARTLADARSYLSMNCPDLILLDIMMPDGNGFDLIRDIRLSAQSTIPILVLTGLTAPSDIVRGLKVGGDDYLTKPYNFNELFARVEAILRRSSSFSDVVIKGHLHVDVAAAIAKFDGRDLLLSKKECALLILFVRNEEKFFTAEYLYEKVWGTPMGNDNIALKGAIKRLRAKIDGCGWSIGWYRGEGYTFEKT